MAGSHSFATTSYRNGFASSEVNSHDTADLQALCL